MIGYEIRVVPPLLKYVFVLVFEKRISWNIKKTAIKIVKALDIISVVFKTFELTTFSQFLEKKPVDH